MISVKFSGDDRKARNYFLHLKKGVSTRTLEKYARQGVAALMNATPVDSGLTASSWDYTIIQNDSGARIEFTNSNMGEGWAPIAILLQYGHADRGGGWVQGVDYINPALKPLFDKLADDAWKEVIDD